MSATSTLFQTCFWVSIGMVCALGGIAYVSSLDIWGGVDVISGPDIGDTTGNAFQVVTGLDGGMEFVWGLAVVLGGVGSLTLAWITNQTTPIGIYLFETVIWTAYIRSMTVITNYTSDVDGFILMMTFSMVFLTTGAVAGMLSGSG
jgi:hypothetical protein